MSGLRVDRGEKLRDPLASRLPLPALLSYLLVAFTVEFDNESEHRLPHRTTRHGSTAGERRGPWLVSLVMWVNCLQFVDEKGITVRELEKVARTNTHLNGMLRWGYVSLGPDPAAVGARTARSSWLIRLKRGGEKAREIWRPIFGVIENRWRERFGHAEIQHLRQSLLALIDQMDLDLPDCLPILGYGLISGQRDFWKKKAGPLLDGSALSLVSLLSKVLLAFAIEFEEESEVSLAIGANVLRLVGEDGIRVRDLPHLAGVSKEGIAMALSFLEKQGFAVVKPESDGSRVKALRLTAKGELARKRYFELVSAIEERWQARYGEAVVQTLRDSLAKIVDDRGKLFAGMKPYADGWRASQPKPEKLPHFPMVLHRGGFPDGS